MSRRRATLFSLIGEMTALLTMLESWRNVRMARSTPWRAILAMLAGNRVIQSGAARFMAMVYLRIRKRAKDQRFIFLVILPYIKNFKKYIDKYLCDEYNNI